MRIIRTLWVGGKTLPCHPNTPPRTQSMSSLSGTWFLDMTGNQPLMVSCERRTTHFWNCLPRPFPGKGSTTPPWDEIALPLLPPKQTESLTWSQGV